MDQQTLMRISSESLRALSDERVMMPSAYSESIADLKNLLRQFVSGRMAVGMVQQPEPQDKAPEDDASEQ